MNIGFAGKWGKWGKVGNSPLLIFKALIIKGLRDSNRVGKGFRGVREDKKDG